MMTMDPHAYRLAIGTLLQQELDLVTQFEALLADEYRVIAERDIAAFELIISDKTRRLGELARLEQERAAMQEGACFDAGHAGMTGCLTWCDPHNQLVPLWQNLLARARACHEQNRKNQLLADLCSRHARETLHLLRGEDPCQDLYQADGETDNRHGSRSLARV
jgi:flagellar biosynthesis/type III secretory pathway chaperone